ncbi:MAG: hypothetical protein NTX50_11985 [Candidatus Sumerlaeota bacterium]|nr:hypothetical protein [Candidatus Sumerlaeota bacterium]
MRPPMESPAENKILEADRVIETVEQLRQRIEERFAGSGLGRVCQTLVGIAHQAKARVLWIQSPIILLRIAIGALVLLILAFFIILCFGVETPTRRFALPEYAQMIDAGINDLIFISIALFFAFTLEGRIKRRRALDAIHELRALAHVIDMHQLTKDPYRTLTLPLTGSQTASSPQMEMTAFNLVRYLDYCTEMLSLTGKLAVLYVQHFNDPVVLNAANEIETLANDLSRKIWQKMMILYSAERHPHVREDE